MYTEANIDIINYKQDYSCIKDDLDILESLIDNEFGEEYRNAEGYSSKELLTGGEEIHKEFYNNGLFRDRAIICIRNRGVPVVYAICEYCSLGVNMSELTNSFKIFIADRGLCTQEVINRLGILVLNSYYRHSIYSPVLLASPSGMIPAIFSYKKKYKFWYLDTKYCFKLKEHFDIVTKDIKKYLRKYRKGLSL
jgi:hypothetical protein